MKDYSTILDPEQSEVELVIYYQRFFNKCLLPSYMSSFTGGHTGKMDRFFTTNLLVLIILKHVHGIPWVENMPLNIEKNPLDAIDCIGYEEHIKSTLPKL